MIVTQLVSPRWKLRADFSQYLEACFQLNVMALAVIKGDGFYPLVFAEGLGQAGGGVLTTGEQNKGCGVHASMLEDALGGGMALG